MVQKISTLQTKLYIARKERQLKLADVAKVIHLHPGTYRIKELGERDFTLPEAIKLACFFNMTLDDLFGRG